MPDRPKQRIAILGAGLSGQAALRLVHALGDHGQLFDEKAGEGASIYEASCVAEFGAFILSPGFAAAHPWRLMAEASGKPCYSELGFAAQYWKGAIYAVTGTNGKTTITNLLAEALQASGRVALTAGNIGYPLSDAVLSAVNQTTSVVVCEVSSFQAELPVGLELDALLWSNFAEDHLDRYDSMWAYFAAKAQLFACLKDDGICVLGESLQPWLERFQQQHPLRVKFDTSAPCPLELSIHSSYRSEPHCKNLELVARFWNAMDLPSAGLETAANQGQLAPHRLKLEATWQGVCFWNDSKATNFHAALAALHALSGPIYWIGGGRGKGGDLATFGQAVLERVEAVFLYGEIADEFARHLNNDSVPVQVYTDLEAAVQAATIAARVRDPSHVLLSPGFASLDQFNSYAERGKCFISAVLSLMRADPSD